MSVRAVRPLAAHSPTSPDRITEDELRDSFLSLQNDQHSSRAASTIALGGIEFFSEPTRQRAWSTLPCVRALREQTRPVIRSVAAGRTMLAPLQLLRSRACLMPISSCGLRLPAGPPCRAPILPGPACASTCTVAQAPRTAPAHGPHGHARGCAHIGPPTATPAGAFRHRAGAASAWPRPPPPCPAIVSRPPCVRPSQPAVARSGRPSTRCATALPPLCWRRGCLCASSRTLGGTTPRLRRPSPRPSRRPPTPRHVTPWQGCWAPSAPRGRAPRLASADRCRRYGPA